MRELTGTIFNVQHFTVHDGPGIRTELFMKGCNLQCKWCSNPEGMRAVREVGIYPDKCIGLGKCGACTRACKNGVAFMAYGDQVVSIDRDKCRGCMCCTEACPGGALKAWGKIYTVDEALKLVMKDEKFYRQSGGGVTVSGGEALLQADFIAALFAECEEQGVSTCLESALNVPRETVEKLLPVTDWWISDIKHMDSAAHRAGTGVGNERILENLCFLAEQGVRLILRIPIIEGFNATEENIRATGKFIVERLHGRVTQLQLLPYRKLGIEKYESLNRPYPMGGDFEAPPREAWEEKLLRFREILRDLGVRAEAGTGGKLE